MRIVALICIFMSVACCASAQASREQNQTVFTRLVSFIDRQVADSIYDNLTDEFRHEFSRDVFTGFMTNSVFPLGKVKSSSLLGYKDGHSSYRVDFATAQREVVIGADSKGHIAMLTFKPFSDPASKPRKSYKVPTTNKRLTTFDIMVDSIASRYIGMQQTVGLSIGIWKNGKEFTYNYGETKRGNKTIPQDNTIFEIGSISKTFTATLLAYYVGQQRLSLSDPITKYLPDSVAANKNLEGITLQMLSNHTSGLASVPLNMYMGTAADKLNPYRQYSKQMLFSYLKVCAPEATPGTRYAYSNLAVGLLGVILERVSGMSYEQMLEQIICKPLHMDRTMQYISAKDSGALAAVYNEDGQQVQPWDFDAIAGAGCVRSTTHDLLLYARANMQQRDAEPYKAMQRTHIVTNTIERRVGLGWHYTRDAASNTLWHNGGTGGSRSFLAFNGDKQVAVVVLSNCAESVDETGMELLELVAQ